MPAPAAPLPTRLPDSNPGPPHPPHPPHLPAVAPRGPQSRQHRRRPPEPLSSAGACRPHRRQAGPYCPAPPRPAARAASSPGWALLPGSSSPRCAGRIVARLGPIARLLLAPLRGPHRRQAGPYCPAPPRPAARAASSPGSVITRMIVPRGAGEPARTRGRKKGYRVAPGGHSARKRTPRKASLPPNRP